MHANDSTAGLHTPKKTTLSIKQLSLTIICYGLLSLFIVIDGIRHSQSLKSLLLTLPHCIASLALARSVLDASKHNQYIHTALFLSGLVTFAALA